MPKLTRSLSAPPSLSGGPSKSSTSDIQMSEPELEKVESNGQQQQELKDSSAHEEREDGLAASGMLALFSDEQASGDPQADKLAQTLRMAEAQVVAEENAKKESPPAPKAKPAPQEQAQAEGDKVLKGGSAEQMGAKALEVTPEPVKLAEQSSGEMDAEERELHQVLKESGINPSDLDSIPDISIEETAKEVEQAQAQPQASAKKPPPPPGRKRGAKPPPPPGRKRSGGRAKPPPPPGRKRRGGHAKPPPPPPPSGVAPLQSARVQAGKDAKENAEVDSPGGDDLASEAFDIIENVGDFTALFGNGGAENTGHNAVGSLDWSDHSTADTNKSGSGDMTAGLAGMGSDTLGMFGGIKKIRKGEDKAEKVQGGFETASSAVSFQGNWMKFTAGAIDANQGNTDSTVQYKMGGDSLGVASDGIGLVASAIDNGRNLKKFGKNGKTWKEASKATRARRVGNAVQRTVDMGSKMTGMGNNIAKLAQQGADAVNTGPNVVGQYVLAPIGLAMSTYEMGKNAAAMVTAGKNRSKLTKSMDNFETRDSDVTGKDGTAVQVVDDREADQMAMLEHLHGVNVKRQKRAGLNMTTNAISAAGSAMTLSGMGAVGGMAAGATAAGIKLGAMGVRKGKQFGRDRKSKNMAKLQDAKASGALDPGNKKHAKKLRKLESMEKDERKHRFLELKKRAKKNRLSESEMVEFKAVVKKLGGNEADPMAFKLSRKQRISLAFRFNTNKSSKKKEAKNTHVAETILQLWRDVEGVDKDTNDKAEQKKLERWKAAYHGMGVDQKKWKTIVRVAKNDDQKLLKEILKQMGKRD